VLLIFPNCLLQHMLSSIRNHPDPYHPYPYVPSPPAIKSTAGATLFFQARARLGNLIFQLAGAMEVARYYNMKLAVDQRMHSMLNRCFGFDDRGLTSSLYSVVPFPQNVTFHNFQNPPYGFKPKLFQLNDAKDFSIFTWFQSWKYFQYRQEEIRTLFTFANWVRTRANTSVTNCLKEWNVSRQDVTLIGIHVRKWLVAGQQRISYFQTAMRYFLTEYRNVYFIVCSNDLEWSHDYFQTIPNTRVVANHFEVDMAVLASCDHVIMSVGTFGWWSGWLAGGEVFYYNCVKWMVNNRFPASEYYLPGWIPLC